MSALAEYQLAVATAITAAHGETPSGAGEFGGAAVIAWAVESWAKAQLTQVCPLTTTLLQRRRRWDEAVVGHLLRPGRPAALHPWGRAFLVGLFDDNDTLVADVARLEHSMVAPERDQRPLPDPWVWRRKPESVLLALMTGRDPAEVPPAGPWHVTRNDDGRLVTTAVSLRVPSE